MVILLKRAFIAFLAYASLTLSAASGEPEFIVGFPEDNMSNSWRAAQMAEIEAELSQYPNIKFLKADAKGSVAQNILDIESMAKKGAQLLFLGPRDPKAIGPIISKLHKRGIRIVLLTRTLDSADYDTYVSPDDFKIAYEAAVFLAEKIGGAGRILMLEGVPTTSTSERRKRGFINGLANYPDIQVTSRIANYSRREAVKVVDKVLRDGLTFDAIFAHNDAMATGARIVLKGRGIQPGSIPTVGIDFLPETREAIIKGEQLASFTYPTAGKAGVAAALDLLRGKKVQRFIAVPFQLVTHKNVYQIKTVY